MRVFPAALGPDNVPPVTDVGEACRDASYAVFSACANSRGPQVRCSDMDTLGTWLGRSLTAADVSDLFA